MIQVVIALLVMGITLVAIYSMRGSTSPTSNPVEEKPAAEKKEKTKTEVPQASKTKSSSKSKSKSSVAAPKHHLYVSTLKGFSDEVTAVSFAPRGRNVAVASKDRTLRVFSGSTITTKEAKYYRVNTGFDYPSAISFMGDGKEIAVAMQESRKISIYHLTSNAVQLANQFPETAHKQTVRWLKGGAKFVASCSEENDTTIRFWNAQGAVLSSFDTNQVRNNFIGLSHDERFLAIAAWTSDVKIYEIKTNKGDGTVQKVAKAVDLKGHKTGVASVAFSHDVKTAITSCKNGTLNFWKIDVRYEMGEDAKLIRSEPTQDETHFPFWSLLCSSPTAPLVVGTFGPHLQIFNTTTGQLLETVLDAHESEIVDISFSSDGQLFATAGRDNRANVWRASAEVMLA